MLKNNETTSEELIKESLEKSHELQEKCNPFVTIIDDAIGINVTDNLLSGIPYGAKDNYSTKDCLTTGSSNTLKDYVPFFDATVIKKLKDAGAIYVNKTAMDEFGMGGTGTTAHTGIIKNPWDTKRMCAGSSSGSAAAVAYGVYPFALGSDTGDSIRKPAAFCGIVGYKPTYGMISRYGLFPFASSLDHCGVLTRSVEDAAIVVDQIKEKDMKRMRDREQTAKEGEMMKRQMRLLLEEDRRNEEKKRLENARLAKEIENINKIASLNKEKKKLAEKELDLQIQKYNIEKIKKEEEELQERKRIQAEK